jgi:predicted glycoside hydrolase/deacetylase ChbG (UPF0249 family)
MTRRIDSGIVSNYTVGVVEQTTILLTPPPQKKNTCEQSPAYLVMLEHNLQRINRRSCGTLLL